MKTFHKFTLLLALAFTLNLRAATNDAAQFSGMVVDAQGAPVAGATVDLYQYPSRPRFAQSDLEMKQQVITDGQGAFALPSFKGIGFVVVTKGGVAPAWLMSYTAPQGPQKIVLSPSSVLAGSVVDDVGRPVADAEVWVSSAIYKTTSGGGQMTFLFGKTTHDLFSARTSADGKFRIENFPADSQADLSVTKSGMTLRQTGDSSDGDQLPFHAGQEDITLNLEPAASVSGKVVLRDNGQPLASAVVGLHPSGRGGAYYMIDHGTNVTAVSAADGAFEISNVPAGSYEVVADFTNRPIADWVADPVPVTVAAGQAVSGVEMQAYKGGVLEVTVSGKNSHEPIADAGVSAFSEDNNHGGSTGTNGVAYFRLAPGEYSVGANKEDWAQGQTQATVTDGQTTQVTIELNEPNKISGVVRDASGSPVSDVEVGVVPDYGNDNTSVATDANGHYELSWQEPSFGGQMNITFHLLASDTQRKLAAISDIEETTTNLDVTLKPAMSVSGGVQNPDGQPVTNATAYIIFYQDDNSSFTIRRQPVSSDARGRIQMDALPMGERYGWSVTARGYGSAQEQMDTADPTADHYAFPPLIIKPADRRLAGRVLGANGSPAAGVQVYMQGEGQSYNNAISDADGRFSFNAVCEGPVTVSANLKGLYGQTQAMGGDTNVVIRFDNNNRYYTAAASQTLTGNVYDASGDSASGVRVVVSPSMMGPNENAKTDDSGKFSVSWQPQPGIRNGKYFAIARDTGRNLAAIEPINTKTTSVDLHLGPGFSISGTIQDAQGTPLRQANVNLNIMAGNMGGMVEYQGIRVKSDGTFTIPALPMGQRYMVMVTARGHGSVQKNIGPTQSSTNSIQFAPFKLKTANLELAGEVLDAKGKPLPGVYVYINGKGQPNGQVNSDGDGRFHFKVCDGPIQVYAFSPSGTGRNNSGFTYALGGDTHVVLKMGVQGRNVRRLNLLKPQPWTLGALVAWPAGHKTGMIVLLSLQGVVLLGTAGGIFWYTRRRGPVES